MTIEFSNCLQGTVTYEILSTGRRGTVPIRRVTSDHIPNCEQQPLQSGQ